MGLANDATNLEMGPGNDAGASTDCVRQPGPKEVSTDCVRQARPKEVLRASDPTQPPVLQRFATASSQQNPPAHSSGRSSSNERVMFVLTWALLPRTIRQSLLQIEIVANPPGYQPGPKDSTGKWLLQ